jgi:hypothetical protein
MLEKVELKMSESPLPLGRVKSKYLTLDVIAHAFPSSEAQTFLHSVCRKYRRFLVTNRAWYPRALESETDVKWVNIHDTQLGQVMKRYPRVGLRIGRDRDIQEVLKVVWWMEQNWKAKVHTIEMDKNLLTLLTEAEEGTEEARCRMSLARVGFNKLKILKNDLRESDFNRLARSFCQIAEL